LRQSGWMIVIPPALVVLTAVVFLLSYFSPTQEIRERSLWIFQQLSVLLVPVAALLWAHFFVGNVYERAKNIFAICENAYLTKLILRAGVPFALFVYLLFYVLSLLILSYSQEINSIAVRTALISIAYFIVFAMCSFLFATSYGGFLAALFFTLFSYGATMGWFFNVPLWLNPLAEQNSFAHIWFLSVVVVFLYGILCAFEKIKY